MDELVKKGSLRLHWVETHMPVLMDIRRRFIAGASSTSSPSPG